MTKELFVEYLNVRLNALSEDKLKAESATGGKAIAGAWEAPVWQLDKLNLNGRVYSTELAERIVAQNPITGACDGHDPDYHQDFQNYKAVCKNPSIRDGQLWVEIYIIDEAYDQLLVRLSDLGLGIGVSSVGFGETDMDGVVNAQTYELVRYLDFVTSPAGKVYASKRTAASGNASEGTNGESADSHGTSGLPEALKARIERCRRVENILKGEDLK